MSMYIHIVMYLYSTIYTFIETPLYLWNYLKQFILMHKIYDNMLEMCENYKKKREMINAWDKTSLDDFSSQKAYHNTLYNH